MHEIKIYEHNLESVYACELRFLAAAAFEVHWTFFFSICIQKLIAFFQVNDNIFHLMLLGSFPETFSKVNKRFTRSTQFDFFPLQQN